MIPKQPPSPFFCNDIIPGGLFQNLGNDIILNRLEHIRFRTCETEGGWQRIRNKRCWKGGRLRGINLLEINTSLTLFPQDDFFTCEKRIL